MSDYRPVKGDRVRVVIEDVVIHDADGEGIFETKNNWFEGTEGHVVSVEKIEPDPVLPDGLTISEDGILLNWLGENYVRQQVDEPSEVFKPGDVVRGKYSGLVFALGEPHRAGEKGVAWVILRSNDPFEIGSRGYKRGGLKSDLYELVALS